MFLCPRWVRGRVKGGRRGQGPKSWALVLEVKAQLWSTAATICRQHKFIDARLVVMTTVERAAIRQFVLQPAGPWIKPARGVERWLRRRAAKTFNVLNANATRLLLLTEKKKRPLDAASPWVFDYPLSQSYCAQLALQQNRLSARFSPL